MTLDDARPRLTASMLLALVAREGRRAVRGAGYRALASAVQDAVVAGDVPEGSRLPPERDLAREAGVSRGTVVAAYERLREEGVVVRRQGSGTWVRRSATTGVVSADLAAALRARRLTARVLDDRPDDLIDLGLSALSVPWGLGPDQLSLDPADLVQHGRGHGYLPHGLQELRSALAARAGDERGPDAVAVTHGAQHAIALAARHLIQPGDTVVVERPTFPGAVDVFARAGARLVSVPTDAAGTRVAELGRLASRTGARLVYLVPTCHSPTGTVMPMARRRELAALVDRSSWWLVEDETLAPLRFDGPPPPTVSSLVRTGRTVVVGSLAKEVWGGLRVGWLRSDPATIERLGRLRAASDLGGPVPAQLVALQCLDGLDGRTARLRGALAGRAAHLVNEVAASLPTWEVTLPDGGLSLWCRLPTPDAERLSLTAPEFGVSVLPGGSTTIDDDLDDHVRLSFAESEPRLSEGVARLTRAWRRVTGDDQGDHGNGGASDDVTGG